MKVTVRRGWLIAALSVAAILGVAWSSWADVPASDHHDTTPARLFAGLQDPKVPLEAAATYTLGTCHFYEGDWDLALEQ